MPRTLERGGLVDMNRTFLQVIADLGLSTGLRLCLDAGDSNSIASGAGTKWLDVSGGGYDFFRGTTSGADATDPTFVGTPGKRSAKEFWAFDGGDWFTYDSANEAWMNNLHKAGAIFSVAGWVYITALGGTHVIYGTNAFSTSFIGSGINVRSTNALRYSVTNGIGSLPTLLSTAIVQLGWNFVACAVDDVAGTGVTQVNGTQESFAFNLVTPSAAAATYTMEITNGGSGAAIFPEPAGAQLGGVMMWEPLALTTAQLMSLFTTTRSRYGV